MSLQVISHQFKCIFIEVPKTGSTSIRGILGKPDKPHLDIRELRYELEKSLVPYDFVNKRAVPLTARQRAEMVDTWFREYFKFGFVRNPWDRTVSLYRRREGMVLSDKIPFEQFVDWIAYASDTCLHPSRHRDQLDWLTDADGNVLVDFIGRFERLDQDWEIICRKLGLGNKPLPHMNRNPAAVQRHYTEFYTPATRDIIGEKFHRDIEFFGYTFAG